MPAVRPAVGIATVLALGVLLAGTGTASARAPSPADSLVAAGDLPGSIVSAQKPTAWLSELPKAIRGSARQRAAQELATVGGSAKTLVVSRAIAFASTKAATSALARISHTQSAAVDATSLGVTAAQAAAAGRLTWQQGPIVAQLVYLADSGAFGATDAAVLAARVRAHVQRAIKQTGWEWLLEQAGSEPGVTQKTALQAFALAIGPLPGVHVVRTGVGPISSGDPAIEWLLAYWKQLTPGQRAAAASALALGTPRANRHGQRTTASASDTTTFYPTLGKGATELKALSRLADGYAKEYAGLLHLAPTFKSFVWKEPFALGRFGAIAESFGFDAAGGPRGTPVQCAIKLNPWKTNDANVHEALAHEVFHCFQMQILGSHLAFDPVERSEPWLTEGGATWATCEVQGGPVGEGWYEDYLGKPGTSLFRRTYDSIGFFSELSQTTGVSPFTTMAAALTAGNPEGSYQKLVGAGEEPLLDDWAASFAQNQSRGPAWKMSGPCYKPAPVDPPSLQLSATAVKEVEALPLATTLTSLAFAPGNYVIGIQVTSGRARFSATGIDDVIAPKDGERFYCVGTCSCTTPNADGSQPRTIFAGDEPPYLALTGDLSAGEATITGSTPATCSSKIHVVITGGATGNETDAQGNTHSISLSWHEESDGFINDQLLLGDASSGGLIPLHDDTTKDSLTGTADESYENCHGALTMVPHGLFDPNVRLNPDPSVPGMFVKQGQLSWFLPIRTASWASPQPGVACVSTADFYLAPGASVMPATAVDLSAIGTRSYTNGGSIPVSGTGTLSWTLQISITVSAPGA